MCNRADEGSSPNPALLKPFFQMALGARGWDRTNSELWNVATLADEYALLGALTHRLGMAPHQNSKVTHDTY